MDKLDLIVDRVSSPDVRIIEGIEFRDAAFVVPGERSSLRKCAALRNALIVLSELKRSLIGNGRYLIFTSASGIADEGGWSGVRVLYKDGFVHWDFVAGEERTELVFDEAEYRRSIEDVSRVAMSLGDGTYLEPAQVVFPEDWIAA